MEGAGEEGMVDNVPIIESDIILKSFATRVKGWWGGRKYVVDISISFAWLGDSIFTLPDDNWSRGSVPRDV